MFSSGEVFLDMAHHVSRFRIALLAPILPTLLLASSMSPQKASTDELGTATLYPEPAGDAPSPRYEIRIIDRSGVSRPSFVFFNPARRVTTPGGHGTDPVRSAATQRRLNGAGVSARSTAPLSSARSSQLLPETSEKTNAPGDWRSPQGVAVRALCSRHC